MRTVEKFEGSGEVRSKLDLLREFIPYSTVQDCDVLVYLPITLQKQAETAWLQTYKIHNWVTTKLAVVQQKMLDKMPKLSWSSKSQRC